jgi:hypothetical protein
MKTLWAYKPKVINSKRVDEGREEIEGKGLAQQNKKKSKIKQWGTRH